MKKIQKKELNALIQDLLPGVVGIDCGQDCRIGATIINGHHFWLTVVANGLTVLRRPPD